MTAGNALKCSVVLVALLLPLTGCVGLVVVGAQHVAGMGSEDDQVEKFVVDGATSRTELVALMGQPLHTMKDGSVLIFGGRARPRGLVQLFTEDKRDEHRLIAVIGQDDVLREHLWVGKKKAKEAAGSASTVAAATTP